MMGKTPLKLVLPTDFDILMEMSDGRRQTAPNLGALIDRKSRYMNNRLSELAGYGLVEPVGPSDNSGMYEITDLGRAAVEVRTYYAHADASAFGDLVRALANDDLDADTRERIAEGTPLERFDLYPNGDPTDS